MRSTRIVHVISAHAEGEVGDVIVGGVAPPPGETLWEQSRSIATDETPQLPAERAPRRRVPPHQFAGAAEGQRAQMGFIIMEPVHTPPMSGSNGICVATVLLETGILPMQEPETRLTLEAPGGIVEVFAACRDGRWSASWCATSLPSPTGSAPPSKWRGSARSRSTRPMAATAPSSSMRRPRLRAHAGRGTRARGSRHARHARCERAARFPPPENPDWAHISFCQIAGQLGREDGALSGSGRRDPAWQNRPLAHRDRLFGAYGRVAGARHDGVGDAFIGRSIIGPASIAASRAKRRSAAGPRSSPPSRPRLGDRHPPAHARPERPLARGLHSRGHLGGAVIAIGHAASADRAPDRP